MTKVVMVARWMKVVMVVNWIKVVMVVTWTRISAWQRASRPWLDLPPRSFQLVGGTTLQQAVLRKENAE